MERVRMTQKEFLGEAERRFGEDVWGWKFVCPACGTVQSAGDLRDAGVKIEDVGGVVGFSCVGRFKSGVGCDWTLGGLMQIHELEVMGDDGHVFRRFRLADVV